MIEKKLVCLQVHNDYQIPGGETKTAKLIGDLLEECGMIVIRYYKSNEQFAFSGVIGKIKVGLKSFGNPDTIHEINELLSNQKVDFALIHNVSPVISNSIYKVLDSHEIPIIKYIQNYNLVCLNGALDQGEKCKKCISNPLVGVCSACYKNSIPYTIVKAINKIIFDKMFLGKISAFMPNSGYVKEKHIKFGFPADKMHVMYNYIQGDTFFSEHDEISHDKYLYFGRISREKGVFTVISAFEKMPNLELQICGSGEMEHELIKKLNGNKGKNISFLGAKYGNDLMKIVHDSKCVIVSSEWDEPLPRTILEAYYQGTPVIGTDMGGIPEMITSNETGMIYSSGDINELIDCVQRFEKIDSDSYLHMRKKCFEQHKKMYSKTRYMERFLECVKEITDEISE